MKKTMVKNKAGTFSVQAIGYLTAILLILLSVPPATAKIKIDLFSVATSKEATVPDTVLTEYLGRKVQELEIEYKPTDYSGVIDKLVKAGEKSYLARTTPYVFVVAEMLGAKMQVLAVYKSDATKTTTYNTYFVVNRKDFLHLNHSPTLNDLADFLKRKSIGSNPTKFIFHNKFSTSSYFLPSLFFRDQGIYSMKESLGSELVRIESEQSGNSSTELVKSVGDSEGVFAAVWDGTKAKFELGGKHYQEYGSKVHFIKLPTTLPNDLLVSAISLDKKKVNERISQAIDKMTDEDFSQYAAGRDLNDFLSWVAIDAEKGELRSHARKAHRALTNLRSLVRTRNRPAIIDIQIENESRLSEDHEEAVRQAVRLSETELMVKDDFHSSSEIEWRMRAIHDEAIELTSTIIGEEKTEQTFQISYKNGDLKDLTKRVGDLIRSRLHRIRYLWPYKNSPTVVRDVSFPIDPEVVVQKVAWIDPEKNYYKAFNSFEGKVTKVDFNKFELDKFDNGEKDFDDPMSNISYRVVLKRPEEKNLILVVLTWLYVALMVFSAAGAVYDFKRKT